MKILNSVTDQPWFKKFIAIGGAIVLAASVMVALEQFGILRNYGWKSAAYAETTRLMVIKDKVTELEVQYYLNKHAQEKYKQDKMAVPNWLIREELQLNDDIRRYSAQILKLQAKQPENAD